MTTETPPRIHPIFAKQIECTARKDLDGLVDLYHPEAEWVRFAGVLKGRDEIRDLLAKYWELDLEFVSMDEYIESEDTIMTRSTMRVKGDEVVAFGFYVIRDGMIWRQAGGDEGGSRDWWA